MTKKKSTRKLKGQARKRKTKAARKKVARKKKWYLWGIVQRGGDDWLAQKEIRAYNLREAEKIGQKRKKKYAKKHGYRPGQLTSLVDRSF